MATYYKNFQQKEVNSIGDVISLYPVTKAMNVIGLGDAASSALRPLIGAVQVTLLAANWSASAPYIQTVSVEGMTENWKAGAHTLVSSGDLETDQAAAEAEACLFWIDTGDGIMTFTCDEDKPEADFTIEIPGVLQRSEEVATNADAG